jgi:hypothetical protein
MHFIRDTKNCLPTKVFGANSPRDVHPAHPKVTFLAENSYVKRCKRTQTIPQTIRIDMPKELKVPKAVANHRYEYYVVSAVRERDCGASGGGGSGASGGGGSGASDVGGGSGSDGGGGGGSERMCALVYRDKISPLSIHAYCVDKDPAFFQSMQGIQFVLQRGLKDCRKFLCSLFAFRWFPERAFSLDIVASGAASRHATASAPVLHSALTTTTRLVFQNVLNQGFLMADCWTLDALRRCCWHLHEYLPKPRCPVALWHWSTVVQLDHFPDSHLDCGVRFTTLLTKTQSQAALGWVHTDPQAVHAMHGLVMDAADLSVGTRDEHLLAENPVPTGAIQIPQNLLRRSYWWHVPHEKPHRSSVMYWVDFEPTNAVETIIQRMARAVFGKPCAVAGAVSRTKWLHWKQLRAPSDYELWTREKQRRATGAVKAVV